MGGLPFIKLLYVIVRQISKPVSQYLKSYSMNHIYAKKYLLIPLGTGYHRTEQTIRLRLLGYNPSSLLPVSENQAMETGAEILSEFFIFSIAISFILYEYFRSRAASIQKELDLDDMLINLQERLLVAEKSISVLSYCVSSLRDSDTKK